MFGAACPDRLQDMPCVATRLLPGRCRALLALARLRKGGQKGLTT